MKILIDTREQRPYSFDGFSCQVERVALPVGDYSLVGFQDRIALERKSLDDLIGCLMGENRDRFKRELARSRHLDFFGVVVEATISDVRRGAYRSKMAPNAAMESITAMMVRYRVPFMWAKDRQGGEVMTFNILHKFFEGQIKRFRQATKAA